MRWRTYLRLGRVSNLPTVWTNTLAGIVLATGGAVPSASRVIVLALAFSLFYVAGMFLNDAFDHQIDTRERAERPIPKGVIGAGEVFAIGFILLGAGVLTIVLASLPLGAPGWRPIASSLALAATIVLYDAWHKGNPLSPLLMAVCRVLVYVTAALAVCGRLAPPVLAGAALLLGYLVALTHVAKRESANLRGKSRAVAHLIAGISLLDALLVAGQGAFGLAAVAALGCFATLGLQRYISGT